MKVWRKQIERFLDWHPATSGKETIDNLIIQLAMLLPLPALIYFVYPHFENETLKSILNGLLSPVILLLSWFVAGFIFCISTNTKSCIIKLAIFIPVIAYISMLLHLHWVIHYPPFSLARYLICLSGSCLGTFFVFLELRIEAHRKDKPPLFLNPERDDLIGVIAKLYNDPLIRLTGYVGIPLIVGLLIIYF